MRGLSFFLTVVDTLEFLTGTDGPVDGAGGNAKLFFDLVKQLEGIVRIAVHLVDEGKIGMLRITQTLNSFLVWASTPLEASMTITAESAAIRVR